MSMLHEPAPQSQERDHAMAAKAKLGVKLFWAYCLIYAGFVVINTVDPELMEAKILLGQNLAVVYGFGLILLAIVLGLVYNRMCTRLEDTMNAKSDEEE
jgi:uncharacterized membrane protein (DUF485 family)